jgi:hypothetical protein
MTVTTEDRAEALFVSCLQGSQQHTPDQIRTAVADMLNRLGADGCAGLVAQEYGEHPREAMRRMHWVLTEMGSAFPDSARESARESARQPAEA